MFYIVIIDYICTYERLNNTIMHKQIEQLNSNFKHWYTNTSVEVTKTNNLYTALVDGLAVMKFYYLEHCSMFIDIETGNETCVNYIECAVDNQINDI